MLKDFDKTNIAGIKIVSNYHTHNFLCGHAEGSVCDYVREAVENNYEEIGVSDHFAAYRENCLYINPQTIDKDYLPQFVEAEEKFGDKIKILKSVETAYYSDNDGYYKSLWDKLDYLILGQHSYELNGERKDSYTDGLDEINVIAYCRQCVKAFQTGLFRIFAHPDLIFSQQLVVTENIVRAFEETVQAATSLGVYIELNANGIRNHGFRYPTDLLIESCLKSNAKVVVSSDCHSPKEICDEYVQKLYAYAKSKGLQVVDKIILSRNK